MGSRLVLALLLPALGACAWSVPADPGENAAQRGALEADPVAAASGDAAEAPAADPTAGRLYYARCAQCHEAVEPSAYAPAEWPAIVDRYAPRAGLFGADRARVLAWLQSQAR